MRWVIVGEVSIRKKVIFRAEMMRDA